MNYIEKYRSSDSSPEKKLKLNRHQNSTPGQQNSKVQKMPNKNIDNDSSDEESEEDSKIPHLKSAGNQNSKSKAQKMPDEITDSSDEESEEDSKMLKLKSDGNQNSKSKAQKMPDKIIDSSDEESEEDSKMLKLKSDGNQNSKSKAQKLSNKVKLFDSDSSEESESELKINKEYANRYDQWREKELLQRYKNLQEEVSSSSSESGEEEELEFDENFFRVLSLLKGNDPKIYEKDFVGFQDAIPEPKAKAKKAKPVTVKDYEMQLLLGKNDNINENDEEMNKKKSNETELEKLKNVIMDDDDDDEDCFKSLAPAQSKKNDEDDTEGVIKFLKGGDAEIPADSKRDLSYLQKCWNDPNLDEGEKFLKDFFLNKRYLEKDDDFHVLEELEKLSEDEKLEDAQEQFEHKYNFRFEEPDPEFIKRYPRTLGDSLRRKDSKRKEKREEYTERKQREKEQKREELKRLKAVKRKEIEDKFFKLQEITGKDNLNFDEDDIESDFDPDKHDQKMKELFNDEYYAVEEEQKPVFEYDEEIDDVDWNHWSRSENPDVKEEEQDDDSNPVTEYSIAENNQHDIDARALFVKEMMEKSKDRKRKGRKKSLFAKVLSDPKPLYDPEGKSFNEYLEEYYKLDCEDVISDMPVRFKYRRVIPNDFGLSVDEILKADDKELNRWCSIKKTCQYRQEEEEKYDVQAFQKKAKIPTLKQKILTSVYSVPNEENSETDDKSNQNSTEKKKRKRKKKKAKLDDENIKIELDICDNNKEKIIQDSDLIIKNNGDSQITSKKKKKKPVTHSNVSQEEADFNLTDNKSTAIDNSIDDNNLNESKRKRKKSKKSKDNLEDNLLTKLKNESNSKKRTLDQMELSNNNSITSQLEINISDTKPPFKKFKSEALNSGTSNNQLCTQDSAKNIGNENTSKKCKKKKKNKSRNANTNINGQQKVNKPFYSANKNQSRQETDKRLSLSDGRYAAYNINPKKFKNKIKYSKPNK